MSLPGPGMSFLNKDAGFLEVQRFPVCLVLVFFASLITGAATKEIFAVRIDQVSNVLHTFPSF